MRVMLILALMLLVTGIPGSFDLRVIPEIAQYSNYKIQQEGICAGYAWAKEIAQIVGNAVGLME